MATGRCKECHYEPLSVSAKSCPKCGSTRGAELYMYERPVNEDCFNCKGMGFTYDKDEIEDCRFCKGTGKRKVIKGIWI